MTRAKSQPAFIFMEKALDMSVSSPKQPQDRGEATPQGSLKGRAELFSEKKVQGEERQKPGDGQPLKRHTAM